MRLSVEYGQIGARKRHIPVTGVMPAAVKRITVIRAIC